MIHLLLDESAVRRQGGGRVAMRRQLEHLAEVAQRPNTTIQIIAFTAGFHAGVDNARHDGLVEDPVPDTGSGYRRNRVHLDHVGDTTTALS
jgi:Domain of unknown function (DUF5753)